ncbi:MAG: PhnD/SsuA/transferrin family substrate-binding protein [Oscillospiraceae bacterium]|nr:PhnD/SsuA/transferrin family substrate-binding protein [Oscillospiraceae bacterium]
MRRLLCIICACLFVALLLSACAKGDDASPPPGASSEPADVRVGVIKGPSSIGLIKFMSEADGGEITDFHYTFELSGAADEIVPKIVRGEVDIAAVPPNLASVLYHNTDGKIVTLVVSTLGMLYIVENGDSISSVGDLRGRTVFAAGKGSPPEYVLNYILSQNGIDPARDLTIEWKSEHTECAAALATQDGAIALLPQPFVVVAMKSDDSIRMALDLNREWDRIMESSPSPSALVMGVVVARAGFAEEFPDAVADFLERYAASVAFVNGYVSEAAALVGEYGIFPEAVAMEAIPYCNITFIKGREMMEKLSGYLSVLHEQNPQSIGGELPGDEFYFPG